jgi:hypothetical protein
MSWQAQAEVWPVEMSPSNKLVALRLAWSADPQGSNIFPSTKTVAAECCIDRRTVRNALRFLEAEGFLVQVKGADPATWRPAEYRMDLQALRLRASHPEGGEGVEPEGLGSRTPGVRVSRPPEKPHQKPQEKERDLSPFPLHAIEPETIDHAEQREQQESDSVQFDMFPTPAAPAASLPAIIPAAQPAKASGPSAAELEAAFEEWWLFYPRKIGKGQARKAYAAAIKKGSPSDLLMGVQRFAEHLRVQRTEERYIAHGATWLNGERWLDELPDATAAQPQKAGGLSIQEIARRRADAWESYETGIGPHPDEIDFTRPADAAAPAAASSYAAQTSGSIIDAEWTDV